MPNMRPRAMPLRLSNQHTARLLVDAHRLGLPQVWQRVRAERDAVRAVRS